MSACICTCTCCAGERRAAEQTEPSVALWEARRLPVTVRGETHLVRLVRFERGWLASANAIDGPTLGRNASPYLAVRQALEPLGVSLAEAMAAIGRIDLDPQSAGAGTMARNSGTASTEAATS